MKYSLSLLDIEIQLKKRWKYNYVWGGKQNNKNDSITNYIYQIPAFDMLLKKIENESVEIQNYALNRWYNFWSAKGVESIFTQQKNIRSAENNKDPQKDFYIDSVPFDHKTTVFPKGFGKNLEYAMKHEKELVLWLYENQSQQQRKHWENRFFIVVYDTKNNEHWRIKAELMLMHSVISEKLASFSVKDCVSFSHNKETKHAGILWIVV